MSQATSTQALLVQYQELTSLVTTHLGTLPKEFQEQFKNWQDNTAPLLVSYSSTNPPLKSPPHTNLTSLLIKERLKPHELQKLKHQGTAVHEKAALQLIEQYLLKKVSDPSTTLPLPPHSTDPINSDSSLISTSTFNWSNPGLRKSKNLKSVIVFVMAGFLRTANDYLRQNPLFAPPSNPIELENASEMKDGDDEDKRSSINAQTLADFWTRALIPQIQSDIQSFQAADTKVTNQWRYISVEFPTTDERKGNIDFYFDLKACVASIKALEEEPNGTTVTTTTTTTISINESDDMKQNEKKRKEAPSSSPQLSHPTSKQKLSGDDLSEQVSLNSQLVSLGDDPFLTSMEHENKVYRELAGLFDFAPTTGESRHCIDPNTKDLQQFQFTAMGYINSCYRAKFSTPRQGNAAPSSHASLTLHNDVRFHSVLGLEQYSHVWLLFVFHSNAQGSYRPKITPPRLGERVGCLATRSPHRWNDIGLSLVKLDKIEYPEDFAHLPLNHPSRQFMVHSPGVNSKAKHLPGCARLILSNVDLIDGTPIIDVKPFNPGDIIPDPKSLRLPPWLADAPLFTLQINFHQQAMNDLYSIFKQHYNQNYQELIEKAAAFHQQVGTKDVKIKSMDKTTFEIYSRLYHGDRVAQLGRYIQYFDMFDPAVVLVAEVDEMTVGEECGDSLLSRDQVQEYLTYELGGPLQFYPTITSIKQAIIDTLRNDPRPIWTKFENRNRAIFGFLYDNLNIVYQMNGDLEATVCFLQHRDEYFAICEHVKDSQKANKVVDPKEFAEKRGWVQLIKNKITKTTVDPTDDWAKHIHREALEQSQSKQ